MTTPAPLHSWEMEPETTNGPLLFGSTSSADTGSTQVVVEVAVVCRRLGLDATTLTAVQEQMVVDAIVDCQADVAARLNRPAFPRTETLAEQHPLPGYADLDDPKAYGLPARFDDTVRITSRVPAVDDTEAWDLEVRIGLDFAEHEPIVRYIVAHSVESLRLSPVAQKVLGLETAMTSVSAEGQSVSREQRSQVPGAAGGLPTLDSLRRYRRVAVYRRPVPARAPWPYYGS